jgi:hypothetical protein
MAGVFSNICQGMMVKTLIKNFREFGQKRGLAITDIKAIGSPHRIEPRIYQSLVESGFVTASIPFFEP